jgi:hypothetical protein
MSSTNVLSDIKLVLQLLNKAAEVIPPPANGPVKAISGSLIELIKLREAWAHSWLPTANVDWSVITQTVRKNKDDCRALIERTAAITCLIINATAAVPSSPSTSSAATRTLLDNLDRFKLYVFHAYRGPTRIYPVAVQGQSPTSQTPS